MDILLEREKRGNRNWEFENKIEIGYFQLPERIWSKNVPD